MSWKCYFHIKDQPFFYLGDIISSEYIILSGHLEENGKSYVKRLMPL